MSDDKNTFNIKILNFTKDQELPKFKESRNGLWIEYGDTNTYPNYLLDVYHNKSNKHKAIINKKVNIVKTSLNTIDVMSTVAVSNGRVVIIS